MEVLCGWCRRQPNYGRFNAAIIVARRLEDEENLTEALRAYTLALELATDVQPRRHYIGMTECYLRIATIQLALGRFRGALTTLAHVSKMSGIAGDWAIEAHALELTARCLACIEDVATAIKMFSRQLQILQEHLRNEEEIPVRCNIVSCAMKLQKKAMVNDQVASLIARATVTKNPELMSLAQMTKGMAAVSNDSSSAAQQQALEYFMLAKKHCDDISLCVPWKVSWGIGVLSSDDTAMRQALAAAADKNDVIGVATTLKAILGDDFPSSLIDVPTMSLFDHSTFIPCLAFTPHLLNMEDYKEGLMSCSHVADLTSHLSWVMESIERRSSLVVFQDHHVDDEVAAAAASGYLAALAADEFFVCERGDGGGYSAIASEERHTVGM